MAVIGNFSLKDGNYTGTIRTMTINVKAQLVPNDSPSPGAPDWRIFAGGAELGAGWREGTNDKRSYVSIKLDDPSFTQPVRAAFFENEEEGTGFMVWSRSKPQEAAMAIAAE